MQLNHHRDTLSFREFSANNTLDSSQHKGKQNILFFRIGFWSIVYEVMPNQIIVKVLGRNTIKSSHKSFETTMVVIDVLNVIDTILNHTTFKLYKLNIISISKTSISTHLISHKSGIAHNSVVIQLVECLRRWTVHAFDTGCSHEMCEEEVQIGTEPTLVVDSPETTKKVLVGYSCDKCRATK